eukprot:PhM_4_TR13451/c0_g1_i1/m.51039
MGLVIHLCHLVDLRELPRPLRVVQERALVKAVVIRGVRLRVVRRRQRRHFVTVDSVHAEEMLDLARNLQRTHKRPFMHKLREHADGATAEDRAESAKAVELLVRHAHLNLVALDSLARRRGLQLRRGHCGLDRCQRGHLAVLPRPAEEALEVNLGDTTDRVDVGTAAVVLREIATERLVDVPCAEHKELAGVLDLRVLVPQQKLRKQVREHHAAARLDVLHGDVLNGSLFGDVRRRAAYLHVDVNERVKHLVNLDVVERGANLGGKRAGATERLLRGVLRTHIDAEEDALGELLTGLGEEVRVLRDALNVVDHMLVVIDDFVDDKVAHDANNGTDGCGVRAAGKGEEVAAEGAAAEVVPQPTRGTVRNLLLGRVHLQTTCVRWHEKDARRPRKRDIGVDAGDVGLIRSLHIA